MKEQIIYKVEGIHRWMEKRIFKRSGDLIQAVKYNISGYTPENRKKVKVIAYRLQKVDECTFDEFLSKKEYVYTFYVRGDLYSFKARGYGAAVSKLLEALNAAGKEYTLAMSREDVTHIVFSNGESIPLSGVKHTKVEI